MDGEDAKCTQGLVLRIGLVTEQCVAFNNRVEGRQRDKHCALIDTMLEENQGNMGDTVFEDKSHLPFLFNMKPNVFVSLDF